MQSYDYLKFDLMGYFGELCEAKSVMQKMD